MRHSLRVVNATPATTTKKEGWMQRMCSGGCGTCAVVNATPATTTKKEGWMRRMWSDGCGIDTQKKKVMDPVVDGTPAITTKRSGGCCTKATKTKR